MKSRMACKFVKIKWFKTWNRTVLAYGCETLKLSKKEQDLLNSFERKILSWMFGIFEELCREYKVLDIVSCIKFKRLRCAEHVHWLRDRYPKKPWKQTLVAIDHWGGPGLNGRKVWKKMPPDFGVAAGSRQHRIEQFGGKRYGRTRLDCGVLCHKLDRWMSRVVYDEFLYHWLPWAVEVALYRGLTA
jgi:hypothetical protein